MTEMIPATPLPERPKGLYAAAPALLDASDVTIPVLASVASLPNLPTQLRIDIAKAMAMTCDVRHHAIHGRAR